MKLALTAALVCLGVMPLAAQNACPPVTIRPLSATDAACASRETLGEAGRIAPAIADWVAAEQRTAAARGAPVERWLIDTLASPWNSHAARAIQARIPGVVIPRPDSLRFRVPSLVVGYVERRGDSLGVQLRVTRCTGNGEAFTWYHLILAPGDTVLREDMRGLIVTGHGEICRR